ncbi:MAG: hypothetical protein WDO16_13260 [Bacteroidota bacterium]
MLNTKEIKPLVTSRRHGLKAVLGMKTDDSGKYLFAISLKARFIPTQDMADSSWSATIFKFNAADGALLQAYPATDSVLFNDLVITEDNTIYVTDTFSGSLYRIDDKKNSLEEFLPAGTFDFPNGITSFKNILFVATEKGISRLNTTNKQVDTLETAPGVFVGAIDGLYFYKNSLIGIQNGVEPRQIIRIYLDEPGSRATRIDTLERVDKARRYFSPTTGTIVGKEFYYIANAQVRSFDKDGKIVAYSALEPVVIRRIKLKD